MPTLPTDLLASDAVPTLWRLARLDHDGVRGRPVLLYPEGVVFLNETGLAILELCDGQRTLAAITVTLAARYGAEGSEGADVAKDVADFVGDLVRRELVDVR
jgi:coenzyme PQQ biosynthesis protein PqqD